MVRKVLEFGLFAAILISICGFGGTEPISWGICEALIFLLGLILLLARQNQTHIQCDVPLFLAAAVLIAWISIQLVASHCGKIGFDIHAIQHQALALASCAVAFVVTLQVAGDRQSRRRLALLLVGVGIFEALYGLAQYLAGWQYIWNVPRRFYQGSATGTYINHNHFAGLLEMILPFSLCLALYHWQSARRRYSRGAFRLLMEHFGDPEILKSILFLLSALLLLTALIFSFSRMGLISMLVSLALIVFALLKRQHENRFPAASIVVLLVLGIVAAAWIGVGPVVEHFEQLPQNEPLAASNEGRLALWKDATKLVRAHPLSGVGLGSFEYAFTEVQSVQLRYVADHAHNDYLEFAAELGIPAAACLCCIFAMLLTRAWHANARARSKLTRSLALGALAGASALLVHALADFNFYIPANALTFSVILAIGYAAWLESQSELVLPPTVLPSG
jgi:O-antigen ligase